MFGWVNWLWSIQADWGSTWLIGFVAVACLGILGAGVMFEAMEGDDERGPLSVAMMVAVAVVGAFWPLVLIALPFIVVIASLFVSGIRLAQSFERASR